MEQIESSDEDSIYLTASDEEIDSGDNKIIIPSSNWSVKQPPVQIMTGHIEIWKFGSTSGFRTVPVTASVSDVISIAASNVYGANRENISLFLPYNIIGSDGKMSDHIIHGVDSPKVFIVQRPESRTPQAWLLTSVPDMINQWEDDSRVLMPCGHAITPDNLYDYCMSQMKSGHYMFKCPAVPDPDKVEICGREWTLDDVIQRACLSEDERNVFEMMLSFNWLQTQRNIHTCPQCGKFIESECFQNGYCVCQQCNYGGIYKFCVFCLQPWNNAVAYGYCGNASCNESLQKRREILISCPDTIIVDVPNCPTVRACPNCNYLVQNNGEECKHMDCPSINCTTKFCFICLRIKNDGDIYWPCGGAFERCNPAPRQSI